MTRLNHRSNPKALELLRQQQATLTKQPTNVAKSAPAHTPHAVPLKAGVSHVTKTASAKAHPPLSLPADKAKEVKSLDSRLQAAQKQLRDIERRVSADNGRATRGLRSAEALTQQVAELQATEAPTAEAVQALRAQADTMKLDAKHYGEQGANFRAQAAALDQEAIKLDTQIDTLRAKGYGQTASGLETKAQAARQKAAGLVSQAEALQTKAQQLTAQADNALTALTAMEQQLAAAGITTTSATEPSTTSSVLTGEAAETAPAVEPTASSAASSTQASPEPTATSASENSDIALSESPTFPFPDAVKEANDEFAKMFSGAFKLDSMMEQAFKLMNSESQADQLKGQFMLQKAQRLFELISSAIRSMGEMQKTAIGNIR